MSLNKGYNEDERSTGKIAFYVVICACLIYVIYGFIARAMNEDEVKKGYYSTQGWIKSYTDRHNSDAGMGRTITYNYKVDSKIYSRQVYTQIKFAECDDSISAECKKKRFWVIYSKSDPRKSLVNLKREIQDGNEEDKFPGKMEDFI